MVALGEVDRPWRNGTYYRAIPRAGVVLHNNQASAPGSTYTSAGGWQRMIGRRGTIFRDVPDAYAAWHAEATGHTPAAIKNTRWRPGWLSEAPDRGVSDANYSTYGLELEGYDQTYTEWQYGALRRALWDWTRGLKPIVTHQQLQKDRTDPVRFDYQGMFGKPYAEQTDYYVPFKDPLDGGFIWPLAGTDWQNPLGADASGDGGGFNFLDWTDSGRTPHPAIDLNAGVGCHSDAGNLVVSPCKGVVLFAGFDAATARSVGWNTWIQDEFGLFHHFCHFQDIPTVKAGDSVVVGQQIGRCGATKGWDCEHLHWEIRWTKPPAWNFWPYNWSRQEVAAEYLDPFTWLVVKGSHGMEPVDMARLNDRELYNVINNGWQQLRSPGVPCDANSAHYKLIVDRVHTERMCPLPLAPEFDHGQTEEGKRYSSQWWSDGTMSVWVDGMEKAELGG